jgi:hypothetical protein
LTIAAETLSGYSLAFPFNESFATQVAASQAIVPSLLPFFHSQSTFMLPGS